jgi:hypothetical protein
MKVHGEKGGVSPRRLYQRFALYPAIGVGRVRVGGDGLKKQTELGEKERKIEAKISRADFRHRLGVYTRFPRILRSPER